MVGAWAETKDTNKAPSKARLRSRRVVNVNSEIVVVLQVRWSEPFRCQRANFEEQIFLNEIVV